MVCVSCFSNKLRLIQNRLLQNCFNLAPVKVKSGQLQKLPRPKECRFLQFFLYNMTCSCPQSPLYLLTQASQKSLHKDICKTRSKRWYLFSVTGGATCGDNSPLQGFHTSTFISFINSALITNSSTNKSPANALQLVSICSWKKR